MPNKKNQRKKSVVDAHVQWTLARRVVLHFCLFVCAGAVFGLIFQILSNPMDSLSSHLAQFWQHNFHMLVALFCMMPIFVRDTLTLSNRIAGPICRLRDSVQRIGNGEDVAPLKFRRKDMWDDLPAMFNSMVDRLRAEAGNVRTTISTVNDPSVDDIADEARPAAAPPSDELVEV